MTADIMFSLPSQEFPGGKKAKDFRFLLSLRFVCRQNFGAEVHKGYFCNESEFLCTMCCIE